MTAVRVHVRRTPPDLLAERYGPSRWWTTVTYCGECGRRMVGDLCPDCELAAAQWRLEAGAA